MNWNLLSVKMSAYATMAELCQERRDQQSRSKKIGRFHSHAQKLISAEPDVNVLAVTFSATAFAQCTMADGPNQDVLRNSGPPIIAEMCKNLCGLGTFFSMWGIPLGKAHTGPPPQGATHADGTAPVCGGAVCGARCNDGDQ